MLIKVTNTRVHHFGEGKCTLIPGVNDVDDKIWGEFKNHPIVKHHLEEGIYVVLEGPAAEKADHGELSGYQEKQAIKLVGETFKKDLLLTWQASEKRPKVIRALTTQIEELDKLGEVKEEEN